MKSIVLVIMMFLSFFTIEFIKEVRKLEMIIYELYLSDFYEYINVNSDFSLKYDKEKLEHFFEKNGYLIELDEGALCFKISFKKFFYFERKYSFYLEKNYELE